MSSARKKEQKEISQRKTRIGFRGDSRPPQVIFEQGFTSRDAESDIYYRAPEDYGHRNSSVAGGDTDPVSAVAVSWRLRPTTYFPVAPEPGASPVNELWIYVVDIDLSEASNDEIFTSAIGSIKEGKSKVSDTPSAFSYTHGRQALDLIKKTSSSFRPTSPQVEMLFADEFAVKEIKRENILFAVKCKRHLLNPDISMRGGSYVLGADRKAEPNEIDILSNPNRKDVSPERLAQIQKFLEFEINLSKNQEMRMPSATHGYQRYPYSDPSAEQQIFNQLNQDIDRNIEEVKKKGKYDADKNKWNNSASSYPQQLAVLVALKAYLNDEMRLITLREVIRANKKYKQGGGLFFKSEIEKLVNAVLAFKENEKIQPLDLSLESKKRR